MYAHYFATKNVRYVIISQDMCPEGTQIRVADKKEARAIAKAHNATCWNF